MKIKELGEFECISEIMEDTISMPNRVIYGIGDDAAVVEFPMSYVEDSREKSALLSTDMMVEGVHFSNVTMKPYDVGYRIGTANISDIASMGGIATEILVSMALPPSTDLEYVKEFYRGLKSICRKNRVNIVGGDTTSIDGPMVFNVSIWGFCDKGKELYRHMANDGDIIVSYGALGLSQVGLEVLQEIHGLEIFGGSKKKIDELRNTFPLSIEMHQRPNPSPDIGHSLSLLGVRCATDISDGLSSELYEISKASNVRLVIKEEDLYVHEEVKAWAAYKQKSPYEYIYHSGEEFKILATINKKISNMQIETKPLLAEAFLKKLESRGQSQLHEDKISAMSPYDEYIMRMEMHPIGIVEKISNDVLDAGSFVNRGIVEVERHGKREVLLKKGYEHFLNVN